MTLRVRPEAAADIVEAVRWYEARQTGLGLAFVEEVHAVFERVEAGPLRYPVVHAALRRAVVRRFPFAVYFDLDGDIIILAVLHQRRTKDLLNARRSGKSR